jgi:hypothetical protein
LPPIEASKFANPVTLLSGVARVPTIPLATGSPTDSHDRNRLRLAFYSPQSLCAAEHDCVGNEADQPRRGLISPVGVNAEKAIVDTEITTVDPTELCKSSRNGAARTCESGSFSSVLRSQHLAYPLALLRPRHYGPRRRAPKPCYELPPSHP